jgi:hypothetical protein
VSSIVCPYTDRLASACTPGPDNNYRLGTKPLNLFREYICHPAQGANHARNQEYNYHLEPRHIVEQLYSFHQGRAYMIHRHDTDHQDKELKQKLAMKINSIQSDTRKPFSICSFFDPPFLHNARMNARFRCAVDPLVRRPLLPNTGLLILAFGGHSCFYSLVLRFKITRYCFTFRFYNIAGLKNI